MPHISDTERRAQRKRDYAVQIDMLRKQAWDGCCTISTVRMDESGDEYVVRFYVYHRHDDEARERVRVTGDTFIEAFKKASAGMHMAIALVNEDAEAREAERDPYEDTRAQDYEDAKADYCEGKADDAWLEARASS